MLALSSMRNFGLEALIPWVNQREAERAPSRNKFVETALEYALTYATCSGAGLIEGLFVTILADSDYYSSPVSTDNVSSSQERFIDFEVPLEQAHKTGLGSSAALVTALTAAVSVYCLPTSYLDVNSLRGRHQLHNLAQAAHCAAQGKVGSGFDVAAAAFGSCVYRRFSPSILERLGDVGSEGFSMRLRTVVDNDDPSNQWDMEIEKTSAVIPSGLVLLMCDIDCGSETVGMVKKVLAWRTAEEENAELLWATLQKGNEELASQLRDLSTYPLGQPPGSYGALKETFLAVRSLIREMSSRAKVPIEPDVSTELIDRCCDIPGVIGGVVPGAGGYDAVALLVEDNAETIAKLQKMLETYQATSKGSGKTIERTRLLGVKQDSQGFKQEQLDGYTKWVLEVSL